MRSRDFCAGPARTTRHFFFSAEFIKGDVVTAFDRSLASTDGPQLGRRRSFHRNMAGRKVPLERFYGEIRWFAPLLPRGSVHPPTYRGRKFNCVLSLAHCLSSLSPRERMSRQRGVWRSISCAEECSGREDLALGPPLRLGSPRPATAGSGRALRLRAGTAGAAHSGFRQRAPASLTPARCLSPDHCSAQIPRSAAADSGFRLRARTPAKRLLIANIEPNQFHIPQLSVGLTGSPHRSEDSKPSAGQQRCGCPPNSRRYPRHQSYFFFTHCFLPLMPSATRL